MHSSQVWEWMKYSNWSHLVTRAWRASDSDTIFGWRVNKASLCNHLVLYNKICMVIDGTGSLQSRSAPFSSSITHDITYCTSNWQSLKFGCRARHSEKDTITTFSEYAHETVNSKDLYRSSPWLNTELSEGDMETEVTITMRIGHERPQKLVTSVLCFMMIQRLSEWNSLFYSVELSLEFLTTYSWGCARQWLRYGDPVGLKLWRLHSTLSAFTIQSRSSVTARIHRYLQCWSTKFKQRFQSCSHEVEDSWPSDSNALTQPIVY